MRYYKIDGRRIAENTTDPEEIAILQEHGLLPKTDDEPATDLGVPDDAV